MIASTITHVLVLTICVALSIIYLFIASTRIEINVDIQLDTKHLYSCSTTVKIVLDEKRKAPAFSYAPTGQGPVA